MDHNAIRTHLLAQDAGPIPERVLAKRITGFRGGGMFHSHNSIIEGDTATYITKFQSHEQPPPHALLLELAVARLARLFGPPLAARSVVIEFTPEHVAGLACQSPGCSTPLAAGLAFGTRELPGVVEFRAGSPVLPLIKAFDAARIVGFQTWLEAGDTQMLICADDQTGYSMDHANYLASGHSWDVGTSAMPDVRAICIPGLDAEGRLAGDGAFNAFLSQLEDLHEEDIVDAFGAIPAIWWGASDIDTRVRLAGYTLARRQQVRSVLAAFGRSAS